MDYDKLADAITERTKAVIPVDIAGVMCDYDKIFEVEVVIDDIIYGRGTGKSKKEAEQKAAMDAYNKQAKV